MHISSPALFMFQPQPAPQPSVAIDLLGLSSPTQPSNSVGNSTAGGMGLLIDVLGDLAGESSTDVPLSTHKNPSQNFGGVLPTDHFSK